MTGHLGADAAGRMLCDPQSRAVLATVASDFHNVDRCVLPTGLALANAMHYEAEHPGGYAFVTTHGPDNHMLYATDNAPSLLRLAAEMNAPEPRDQDLNR
jgi:hypothetical protein